MSKKFLLVMAIVIMASLALGACAPKTETVVEEPVVVEPVVTEAPVVEPVALPGADFKVCEITDMGGIDDKSFNATGWKGVTDAMTLLGVEGLYLESRQETDFTNNMNAFLGQDCDLIIGVGFALLGTLSDAAAANPDQWFAGIDISYDPSIANIATSTYNANEPAFLAGYLAAYYSESGIVAAYGGIPYPSVVSFLNGYYLGVQYYNAQKGTDVQVLGWDYTAQEGTMTGDFSNTENGKNVTLAFMDEGADIIMPVAGPVGVGTIAAIHERGDTARMIGVDTDWSYFYPEDAAIIIGSACKKMDEWVVRTVTTLIDGTITGGNTVATLDNGLVSFVLGSSYVDQIPADLQAELDAITAGIIDGSIQANYIAP